MAKSLENASSEKTKVKVSSSSMSGLNPEIWGPHYWFFLHTITLNYPHYPNDVTKKKYYEFICNLPLFIPVEAISSEFSKLIDEYPVSSYLDSRDEFVRWMHFIHNKINEKLEQPKIPIHVFYSSYYDQYKPKPVLKTRRQPVEAKVGLYVGNHLAGWNHHVFASIPQVSDCTGKMKKNEKNI